MRTNGGARGLSRTQPAEVALLVTIAILLQPWIVLSQPSEQSLLHDFYSFTSGWATGCSGGWRTNTAPLCSGGSSSWYGVACSSGDRVTQISLQSCGIRGTLPPQWSSLTNMQTLYLNSNSLSGTLPPQWSSLANMQTLNLLSNSLSGTLPPQWSRLTNMQTLALYINSLNGTLPPQWSSLTNIQYLALCSNSLNGTLPFQWSSLTNMQSLYLYTNYLSGTIPPQWSSLTNIQTIALYINSLNGTLPQQWSSLTNMRYLALSSNSLNGTLPFQWSSLTNMQSLYVNSNSLSGTIPPQWSRLTSMKTLQLHANSLNGTLPPQWSGLTNMQYLYLDNNSLSGTLPPQWSALPSTLYCRVNDNCLNTSNAAPWWLGSTYRNISGQRTTCVAVAVSDTHSESMSATDSLPLGSYLSVSVSSMSVSILRSLSVSISVSAQTRTGWSVTHSSVATWSRWLSSSSVAMPSLSGTLSRSRSPGTYSPSIASLTHRASTTNQVLGTMSLTPLCDALPFAVNTSLRVSQPNNESHCGEYLCSTASPTLFDGVGGVTVAVAYDAMMAAPSVLLLLAAEDGIRRQWLSPLPSVRLGTVALDAVADAAPLDGTVGVVVLRPSSGWPGLAVRPYAVQRLSLVVALQCRNANGTVVSHPNEVVLVVTPRSRPVASSVQAVVQISQGIAGGLGTAGGAETLAMGRLAMSLSLLSCDDALQGFGAGQGVVSVSGDLLAAVDTIVGNVVFVAAVAAAAVLAACVLYLSCASSSCSWMACCHDVMRLPLSLFPVFAATLPSTMMAVVAVLRDASTLNGSAASGAYGSIAVATAVWGGALVLVGSTTRRMALSATLRPGEDAVPDAVADCGSGAVVSTLHRAFRSSTEWVAPQPANTTLFEGTTVLWFLPLDVCTTVAIAVVSALPLSRSAALCVGANAANVFGCAVMLAVAAVRRPFATAFGMVHAVVTYVMVLALAVCGFVLAATSSSRAANNGDAHSMLLAVSFLSGSAAVLSVLKAAVDAAGLVAATRSRLLKLTESGMQSCVGNGERLDDALVGVEAGENDCCVMMTLPVGDVDWDCDVDVLQPESNDLVGEDFVFDEPLPPLPPEGDGHRLSDRLGDLLDAYQNVDAR